MKILILFYSAYGHLHKMAEAVSEGAGEIENAEVVLRQVPETLPRKLKKHFHISPFVPLKNLQKQMRLYSAHQPDSAICADKCGCFLIPQDSCG